LRARIMKKNIIYNGDHFNDASIDKKQIINKVIRALEDYYKNCGKKRFKSIGYAMADVLEHCTENNQIKITLNCSDNTIKSSHFTRTKNY
jgi:hypothetical protein